MGDDDKTPAERPGKRHSSEKAFDFAKMMDEAKCTFMAQHRYAEAFRCLRLAREVRSWATHPPTDERRRSASEELLQLAREAED